MNATQSNRKTAGVAGRVEAADWESIVNNLDNYGCAVIKGLLTPKECRELSSLYDHDEHFRSRIVMARHGFGRGEYKYWLYPLPKTIETLRTTLYPHLAGVGNRWNKSMKIDVQYPETQGLEVLHFMIGASALGRVLVATSEKGVCAVLLGSKEKSLIADLQGRNSRAVLIQGGDTVERALTAVMRTIETGKIDSDLAASPAIAGAFTASARYSKKNKKQHQRPTRSFSRQLTLKTESESLHLT